MSSETMLHRLRSNATKLANAPAYYEKQGNDWVANSWHDYHQQVRQAARALVTLGVEPGGIVTILGFNTAEWIITDLAAMQMGGAAAGIYATNSSAEVKYIIEHADARVILVENADQWEKVKAVREDIACLAHVIMMKDGPEIDDDMVLSWDEFMAKADETPESLIDERLESLEQDQLATLIYTSGTTGPPKGVMLSHRNLAWTAEKAVGLIEMNPSDTLLSYLPLSHIAEQMFSIHAAITAGYAIYIAESMEKLPDNLKEVQPTLFFAVPRVWERFQAGVAARLNEATGVRAKLAAWAIGVAKQVAALRNRGQEPSGLLAMQYKLASRLVFSKLKPALGLGNARYCGSGSAPVAPEIVEFFSGLDLMVHELYGQSEDCGPTTANYPGATKIGTVGKAWPGMEVKIADDGEVVAKGDNVFMGYYKNPEATAETIIDGWLRSGDLGELDSDGYLTIVGRKKDIMITSGGKNIAPKNIESALKNCNLIAEAVLVADRKKFVSALITLDEDAVKRFAQSNGVNGDLHTHPDVVSAVQQEVDEKVNNLFARAEQVRKFTILPRNFTIEDGELTATLKLKRQAVYENWAQEIDDIYAN